jgi:Heavy metal associated domain 2
MNRRIVHDRLVLISHFAGRLRVRAEMFRVLPEVGEEVVTALCAQDGVTSAASSPVTGSVLVTYDASVIELPRLVAIIIRAGALQGIALEPMLPGNTSLTGGQRVRSSLASLNTQVSEQLRGRLDLKLGVPAALTASGLLMLAAGGRLLPQWYDLLFWSFVSFCNLNPHGERRHSADDDAARPS